MSYFQTPTIKTDITNINYEYYSTYATLHNGYFQWDIKEIRKSKLEYSSKKWKLTFLHTVKNCNFISTYFTAMYHTSNTQPPAITDVIELYNSIHYAA